MILGYCRVSTPEQALEDRNSLPDQENVIYGYAQTQGVDRFGVQIYADPGVSAKIPLRERKAGAQLLADMREGDTVIVSKLDRIFRSARDALESVDQFQKAGVHLVLFDMGVQPVTAGGSVGGLFFTMLAAFAEFERQRISERMTQGKRVKLKHGGHIGGSAPYGYRVVGEGRTAKLEPIPEEQEVIARIKDRMRNGLFTNAGMARALKHDGIKNRAGKEFAAYQIQRIAERLAAH